MAQQLTTFIYGEVFGAPPYRGSDPFARQVTYPAAQSMTFPSQGTHFWPTSQGVRFGNNYVYSVIEVYPNGLNQQSQKYGSSETVAQLATKANA